MLDRVQVMSRLLDITAEHYGKADVSINSLINLIEDIAFPSHFYENITNLTDPIDKFCPHEFEDELDRKIWFYKQEFFYEILNCIDFNTSDNVSEEEIEDRKVECINALLFWEDSLQRYDKKFRKRNFKVL
ncbi:hypothetical protein [Paenibacillus macquariensis]|uniref:Uncharacterized protein n=1 Tax=Paenibacillus macquariensis TaxID=948756 RepID=A0ABY1JKQ9_9BACL|nr:hypothetical protein [Paenibacillus macquariensis]MEC0089910.1 hypothetical protein [Paenibacillus macquariensis]OAB31198.1 hypothetical protein PMSM_20990 [Paenibacillus macquariensis subsp. macquariensis]SIQ34100.1 hypothetical protein SAMN05421578_101296 [Paenibacillus macquariensis]